MYYYIYSIQESKSLTLIVISERDQYLLIY